MISIYYIKNNQGTIENRNTEHLGMPKGHRKHTGWIGLTDDEAASAIHRTFTMHSHPNSFMLIWRRLNTLTNVHTHTHCTHATVEWIKIFFFICRKIAPPTKLKFLLFFARIKTRKKRRKARFCPCVARASKFLFIAITATRKRALLI